LGLGFVRPAVNNEEGRQYPQAMLFEITQKNGKLAATEVAQTNLSTQSVWSYANFNEPDKMIEFRMDAAGKGEVLFSLYQSSENSYEQGGKIVKFDLEEAIKGNVVFTEGPFLSSGASWLRRMFTNTEIDRINAFSDEELAVFDNSAGSTTLKAAAILELARNVQDLIPLQNGSVFAQVVDKSKGWWYVSGDQSTEVRIVKSPDAEASEVVQSLRLKGRFSSLSKLNDQSLVVATEESSMSEDAKAKNLYYNDIRTVRLTKVTVGVGATATTEQLVEFTMKHELNPAVNFMFSKSRYRRYNEQVEVLELASGQKLLATSDRVYALSADLKKVTEVQSKCTAPASSSSTVTVVSGQLVVQAEEEVSDEPRSLQFAKHSLAIAKLENDTITCERFVNVPGRARVINNNKVILEDTWAESVKPVEYVDFEGKTQVNYETDNVSGLTSVAIEKGVATLVDQRIGDLYNAVESNGSLIAKVDEQVSYYRRFGGFDSEDQQSSTLYTISTDASGYLTSQQAKVSFPSYASVQLLNTAKGVLVVSSSVDGLSVQSLSGTQLETVKLRPIGAKVAVETAPSLGSYGWSNNYRYDSISKILSNAASYYGAEAFVLE
jgi:hypothetical protein